MDYLLVHYLHAYLRYLFSRILFAFANITEHEATRWYSDGSAMDSIADCITWIKEWSDYRIQLRALAKCLVSEVSFQVCRWRIWDGGIF